MQDTNEKRLKTCWQYFGAPDRLRDARLHNYYPVSREQAAALAICRQYNIADIKAGQGLMLSGGYGTGKSHLSVATVWEVMASAPEQFGVGTYDDIIIYDPDIPAYQGLICSFYTVVDLLDYWRPGGSEAKKRRGDWLFHRVKTDDLVVLDDLGAEKGTAWTFDRLYAVIDVRYRMKRTSIFSTNCSEKELMCQGYGRILSRIHEMTQWVQVEGPDYRRKRG